MNRIAGCFLTLAIGCPAALAQFEPPPFQITELSEYTIQQLDVPAAPGEAFDLVVTLGEQEHLIAMHPSSVRSRDFRIVVDDGQGAPVAIDPPPPTTYRGTSPEQPEVEAAGSIHGSGFHGLIVLPGPAYWAVEPLRTFDPDAPDDQFVVYPSDAEPPLPGVCGVVNLGELALPHVPGGIENPGEGDLIAELAIDMDHQFYALKGNNPTSVTADIESVINGVNVIYERDVDVSFELTEIIMRAGSSPYTTNNGSSLLDQMASHWFSTKGAVKRDLAHLFSGQDFSGSVIGVAYLSGVCSTTIGYGVVQAPGISLISRYALSAHEIGHNFSAQHCSGSTCNIMCASLGGCSGNITSFGSTSKTVIKNYAATRFCLEPWVAPTLQLPFFDDVASTTIDAGRWETIVNVNANNAAAAPISPPNTFAFFQPDSSLASKIIEVPQSLWPTPVFLSFWASTQFIEAGDALKVEYYSTIFSQWKQLGVLTADGANSPIMTPHEWKLPADAYGVEFRLRLSNLTDAAFDIWYVDDVSVSLTCLTDLTGDGQLDLFDFLAFQNLFIGQEDRGDWNRDGQFDIFDFLGFTNSFNNGCY